MTLRGGANHSIISGGALGYAAWLFARSLSKRYTPMISRYAYLMDGDLSPVEKSYTRKVTWVWVVLLAVLSFCLSLGIFFLSMRFPIWVVPSCLLGLLLGEYWLRPYFIQVRRNRTLWRFLHQLATTPIQQLIYRERD